MTYMARGRGQKSVETTPGGQIRVLLPGSTSLSRNIGPQYQKPPTSHLVHVWLDSAQTSRLNMNPFVKLFLESFLRRFAAFECLLICQKTYFPRLKPGLLENRAQIFHHLEKSYTESVALHIMSLRLTQPIDFSMHNIF